MPRVAKQTAARCAASRPTTKRVFTRATGTPVLAWAARHLASLPPALGSTWDCTRINAYLALRELLRREVHCTHRSPRLETLSCLRLRIESLDSAPLEHVHLMLQLPAHTLAAPQLLKANPSLKEKDLRETAKRMSLSSSQIKKAAIKP